MPDTDTNKQIVHRLYRYITENRADMLATVISPSYVDHSNGSKGPGGVAASAARIHSAYDDLRIQPAELVAEGDLVAVRWIETGQHVGQFFNLRPTNQRFEARGLTLYRLRDGLIVESWLAIDPSTIRAQQAAQEALSQQS
jgi:predicted ester cyclase